MSPDGSSFLGPWNYYNGVQGQWWGSQPVVASNNMPFTNGNVAPNPQPFTNNNFVSPVPLNNGSGSTGINPGSVTGNNFPPLNPPPFAANGPGGVNFNGTSRPGTGGGGGGTSIGANAFTVDPITGQKQAFHIGPDGKAHKLGNVPSNGRIPNRPNFPIHQHRPHMHRPHMHNGNFRPF